MADQFRSVVRQLTPEIYQSMRRAVELGRWPDGRAVSSQQRETCMQAMIAWEADHVPEEQRTGYMPPADCDSSDDAAPEQLVTIRLSGAGSNDAASSAVEGGIKKSGVKGEGEDA